MDTVPPHEGDTGEGVVLHTNIGSINAILHSSPDAGEKAVLWVWGARDGYAGPAEGILASLAEAFISQGITSLRLNYRHPGVYPESVLDTLAGLEFLKSKGYSLIALVGHSFGGAVAITAGSFTDQVAAVVALSPQTYGSDVHVMLVLYRRSRQVIVANAHLDNLSSRAHVSNTINGLHRSWKRSFLRPPTPSPSC